jgi:hypothetical protein
MRIDSSGNLLVGKTSSNNNAGKLQVTANATSSVADFSINSTTGSQNAIDITNSANNSYYPFRFWQNGYGGTASGNIFCNGSVTTYNVTSDYRLKNVIAPVSNAGQRLDLLEPIEYDWKAGGRAKGFLAHQFAEVYPSSVTGEKDAVDKDGKPVYQSMQASSSEVMADLIAEIQSLRKRVAQLESK